MRKNKVYGFSILEIGIAFIVMLILGMMAVRKYKDHYRATQIMAAFQGGGFYKKNFDEYFQISGKLPANNNNSAIGLGQDGNCDTDIETCNNGLTLNSSNIAFLYVGDGGGGAASGNYQDLVMKLSPGLWDKQEPTARIYYRATIDGDSIKWGCGGIDVPDKYIPQNCKE